ncbi:MAG: hydantoinase B/oxoprolinase family protein [Actinomycetota bacterium]
MAERHSDVSPDIDPVAFEVMWHRLLDITEEMGIKYMRTSGSQILVGAYDASTGITLPDGQLVAMGPYITTQGHVLRLIIEAVNRLRAEDPGIEPGDMFICNDPYLGATHQPDVATVAPVHFEGELVAWVGASGHWLDIGGGEVGGFNMNAQTVFDEGLRLPPTRIVERGKVREDLVELIINQVREPLAELDLRGQIVANQAGIERLQRLCEQSGPEVLTAVMHRGISDVERRIRDRLRDLPDGVWREVQFLDHDGQRTNLRKIVCTVTKQGDHLTIDFTGSDPQADGFANCAFGGLRAATLSAVCVMLGYDTAWNDGVARCVSIVAPPRTVVTAEYPTPVSLSTISAIILTLNLVIRSLSNILLASPGLKEEAMASWCGTSLGVSIIGKNDRDVLTVCPEASHFAAGCGARTYADGVDTGGIIINTTANIPSIESTESEYPVLYLFRRQLPDSGGAGRYRGGASAGVALMPYAAGGPLECSFAGVGTDVPNGFGLAGGLPGATVRYLRFLGTGTVEDLARAGGLPSDLDYIDAHREVAEINKSQAPFPTNIVEYHNWQGGGGFGDPLERDPGLVAADVRASLVSTEVARALYGVVVHDAGVDEEATRSLREDLRRERLTAAERVPPEDDPAWEEATRWLQEVKGRGILRYADLVVFDFDADEARCARCDHLLGRARADFRFGCVVEESATSAAGKVRGEDYANRAVILRRYYCPGCARQLAAEVTTANSPSARFVLASGA